MRRDFGLEVLSLPVKYYIAYPATNIVAFHGKLTIEVGGSVGVIISAGVPLDRRHGWEGGFGAAPFILVESLDEEAEYAEPVEPNCLIAHS